MKPKNIGFSQKHAKLLAKTCCTSGVEAYAQKEEHWPPYPNARGSYQWIVVLQKRSNKSKKRGGLR